jgi:tRNA(His) 5'-end guanylyltransferase
VPGNKKQKIVVLIDGSNFYHRLKELKIKKPA